MRAVATPAHVGGAQPAAPAGVEQGGRPRRARSRSPRRAADDERALDEILEDLASRPARAAEASPGATPQDGQPSPEQRAAGMRRALLDWADQVAKNVWPRTLDEQEEDEG